MSLLYGKGLIDITIENIYLLSFSKFTIEFELNLASGDMHQIEAPLCSYLKLLYTFKSYNCFLFARFFGV